MRRRRSFCRENGGFAYPAPANWPNAIQDISLWLLFHFILACILLAYLFLLFGVMYRKRYEGDRIAAILRPVPWLVLLEVALIFAFLTLACRDLAFWVGASKQGFKPTVLGGL